MIFMYYSRTIERINEQFGSTVSSANSTDIESVVKMLLDDRIVKNKLKPMMLICLLSPFSQQNSKEYWLSIL